MKKLPIYILAITTLLGCSHSADTGKPKMYVSILPLKSIVQSITGNDVDVQVLVPAGASPESFELTPKQFIELNRSKLVFSIGLIDFERSLISKIDERSKIINLSDGIELIEGSCSHTKNGHHHTHGIDPHIWTSPRELKIVAKNAYDAIQAAYPDSVKYAANYTKLAAELDSLDCRTAKNIARSGVKYFIIYHPALTYYARAYGLQQIAIEQDGKEPAAKRLSQIIGQARVDGVKHIFYQSQYPASSVETIAKDVNADCVEIDPLSVDVTENIMRITDLITAR